MLRRAADITQRLRQREPHVDLSPKSQVMLLELLKLLSPLITGIAIAVVGYSINKTLQVKNYNVQSGREIGAVLSKIGDPNANADQARANALALAAFGPEALPTLIRLLDDRGETKAVAAKEGLRTLAVYEHESVCAHLQEIPENKTRLFSWNAHRVAIGLLGELNCQDSLGSLSEYSVEIKAASQEQALGWFRASDPTPPFAKRTLTLEVDDAINLLSRR